jgi:hypothetical protein
MACIVKIIPIVKREMEAVHDLDDDRWQLVPPWLASSSVPASSIECERPAESAR